MKIVIPGGSGQLGELLAQSFAEGGDEVVILSRAATTTESPPVAAPSHIKILPWDAQTLVGDWWHEIDGADVVINLVGRSVNCRYTPENKRIIKESRVHSTQVVGEAIARAKKPPHLWLQMSTATIYAHRFDAANDEATGIIGGKEENAPETWRFSIDVATSWERALDEAIVPPGIRKVKLRTSVVMGPYDNSPFDILLRLVRLGLGGQSGNGKQYVSWITDGDFIRALRFLIEHEEIDGPVNLASPNPLPNADFMRVLRQAWGAPFGLPATEWMLALGATALQTETELILKSRRVVPGKLLAAGFQFDFPTWDKAAAELCRRWRAEKSEAAKETG